MSIDPSSPRVGPFEGRVSQQLIRDYARATKDPTASVEAGEVVPPVAIATQIWEAQTIGRETLVPASFGESASTVVHGEHTISLHRPIIPDERLRTWVEASGCRPAGKNSLVALRYATFDDRDQLVAEQWWITAYLNTTCQASGVMPKSAGSLGKADLESLGTYSVDIDEEMPLRYAKVSGDWSAHHLDKEVAHADGFEGPFLHGLCTMALCAQAVIAKVAPGDPTRIRRIGVRFAGPAYIGDALMVHLFRSGRDAYSFEATSGSKPVITNGWAELR